MLFNLYISAWKKLNRFLLHVIARYYAVFCFTSIYHRYREKHWLSLLFEVLISYRLLQNMDTLTSYHNYHVEPAQSPHISYVASPLCRRFLYLTLHFITSLKYTPSIIMYMCTHIHIHIRVNLRKLHEYMN